MIYLNRSCGIDRMGAKNAGLRTARKTDGNKENSDDRQTPETFIAHSGRRGRRAVNCACTTVFDSPVIYGVRVETSKPYYLLISKSLFDYGYSLSAVF